MNNDFFRNSYYTLNGNRDPFFDHPNCFSKNLYLVLKNRFHESFDPYHFFVEDITQVAILKADNRILFEDVTYSQPDNIPCNRYELHSDSKASSLVTDLLDDGCMVLVHSVFEKLPIFTFYDPGFDSDKWTPAHVILIVGHDNDYFYYVDEPRLLNHHHKVCLENGDVGYIEKKVMESIFSEHIVCHTIKPTDLETLIESRKSKEFAPIQASIANYNKSSCIFNEQAGCTGLDRLENNAIVYFGREAIQKTIQLCLDPTHTYAIENFSFWSDQDLLRRGIGRRKILKDSLLRYTHDSEIIENIDQSIFSWLNIRNNLIKRKYKKKTDLDVDMIPYFEAALQLEDRLQDNLSLLLSSL
ncbi:MAG: hypothetical protein JWM44_3450 [Bacilli bacterium]|nr:hypothetical protein [Bacilli bacterium]